MAAVHPAPVQPPAAPYGAPPYWAPPRQRPPGTIVGIVMVIVFLVFFFGIIAFSLGLGGSSGAFLVAPLCGFFLILIIIAIAFATGATRRSYLPPPPPIQQPMVPAGMQGPVALNCPNCGAPPVNVDRFGVATCTYCGTRFIVR